MENLPVPFDRRTWQEARALHAAGWEVTVICPLTAMHPEREQVLDGITVLRHPLPLEASGRAGFLLEYPAALFHQARLALRVFRRRRFHVVHACNPPDLMFLVALLFRPFGVRFVYDQHDLSPELFVAKFGRGGFGLSVTKLFERLTYAAADHVIVANERFRELAGPRNGTPDDRITVVRSVPRASVLGGATPAPGLRREGRPLIGYVGVIGEQDGVEGLVEALALLRDRHGFKDFDCVIVGDGSARRAVEARARALGLDEHVTFTGYLTGEAFRQHLAAFEIGVVPDPLNPYTDTITMNKVFEYLQLGLPIVCHRLAETVALAGPAALVTPTPDPSGLAEALARLAADPAERARLGAAAVDQA
ncbi:MAG: glycosyltransferase, partial [Acetobacteraceae bacterium]|nr:glycosyltransferase [Acetobacteraceae bacterium]